MSGTAEARAEWVARVLGVTLPPAGSSGGRPTGGTAASRAAELGFAEARRLESRGELASAVAMQDRATALQREARRRQALAACRAARVLALATLGRLEAAMRSSPAPEREGAILLVHGIGAQPTEAPGTTEAVAALKAYIESDPILAAAEGPNVFGLTVHLRAPLAVALSSLMQALSDQGG